MIVRLTLTSICFLLAFAQLDLGQLHPVFSPCSNMIVHSSYKFHAQYYNYDVNCNNYTQMNEYEHWYKYIFKHTV